VTSNSSPSRKTASVKVSSVKRETMFPSVPVTRSIRAAFIGDNRHHSPQIVHVFFRFARSIARNRLETKGIQGKKSFGNCNHPVQPTIESCNFVRQSDNPPMPHSTRAVDLKIREQAKAMFLAGASFPQVSESLGVAESTLKAWVYRFGWNKVKRSVQPLMQSLVVKEQTKVSAGIASGLEQEGRKLRETLSKDLQGTATRLASHWASPDSIREELERSQVVRQVTAVAAQIYGWDKESVTSTVRIGAMGSLDDQGEGENAVIEAPSE